jgi:ATP-dependent protease ClpP protease subunit
MNKRPKSRLARALQKRFGRNAFIINCDGEITEERLSKIWTAMYEAMNNDPQKLFVMTISTDGGSFDAAKNFYCKIKFFKVNLITVGVGRVWSAGCTLLIAGKKRLAVKHTDFLFHECVDDSTKNNTTRLGQILAQSRVTDEAEQEIFAENLKISRKEIAKMVKEETYFSAKVARRIGIVHKIIN